VSDPVKVLEVVGLSYSYPTGVTALDDITFSVHEGDTIGLLGPNGAGKSTLMLHLNGILSGDGDVRVMGEAIDKANLPRIRRIVGLVFQNPDDQLFMPTVFDDVAFGPMNMGLAEDEVRARVAEALTAVGMDAYGDRPPYHLSLGQKKRISLATVLVMDADVLVLDEPTSGLDPRGRRELVSLLKTLPATKLLATHDMDLAAELCNRVLLLDAGKVVADGPTKEILGNAPLLEAHGLEMARCARFG